MTPDEEQLGSVHVDSGIRCLDPDPLFGTDTYDPEEQSHDYAQRGPAQRSPLAEQHGGVVFFGTGGCLLELARPSGPMTATPVMPFLPGRHGGLVRPPPSFSLARGYLRVEFLCWQIHWSGLRTVMACDA